MLSAIGSFLMILVYMFAPLDNFSLLLMGFPLGIILLLIKFPPMGPFMTELSPTERSAAPAKAFATTQDAGSARCFRR